MTETDDRTRREALLVERIRSLAPDDLARLESLLDGEPARTEQSAPLVSRRQALAGAAVGALALALGGAGGAAAGAAWGDTQGAARERALADQEIGRLRGLVKLYEDLEKIGIDALLGAALSGLESGLKGLKDGVSGLRAAVEAVDAAVAGVEGSIEALRVGLSASEGFVSVVGGQVKLLQSALYEVTGKVAPIAEAVGGFMSDLIAKIPFGVGERILAANSRLGQLVGGLPAAVDGISRQLLVPLRNDWLSDDESLSLKGRLLTPVRQRLLRPTVQHLDNAAAFLTDLESRLFKPARTALADRARVREQITSYRAALGMA